MYGSGVGSLNVYLETNGNLGSPAWSKQGNQGNHWVRGQIGLNAGTSVQVVFEGIRGDTYHSDIAIDDVALKVGTCGQGPGNCNFELDLCSWTNSHADDFDWQMGSGKTTTSGTGPSADHTYNNGTGKYIFIETSAPRVPGHRAVLQSALFQPGARQCLKFWYHMYGSTIGTLNVWVQPQANVSASNIWSMSGGFNCDFEQNLCGWTQDTTDSYNWVRLRGKTASGSTGPTSDHTGQNHYYIYMEASLGHSGSTTRLISPTINAAASQCLAFWYHMYGTHVNALNVLLTGSGVDNTTIWTRNHTQGNSWHQAQIHLGGSSYSGYTNVVFEAIRGQSYLGDIAIDDITLNPGSCNDVTSVSNIDCDFEPANICNYTQETTDDFDWIRNSRSTNSANTGPTNDHTYGTNSGCVSFWYHMYGSGMGTLNVYAASSPNSLGQPIWTLSGNQGNKWFKTQVRLPSQSGVKVVFEGIVGSSYASDIAIDDVKLEPNCPALGACDFENDLCDWTQQSVPSGAGSMARAKPTSQIFSGGIPHPNADHTLGTNNGTYMFFSDMLVLMPRSSHLQLLSPPLAATSVSGVCFHFWYINYGSAFSSLTITLQQGSSSNRTAMWKSNSQQSNSWTEGQVSYYTTGVYQILVDITTLGGRGYIALDDFTFSADMCSDTTSQWDCDFEQGLCSYTQNTDDQFDWTRNKGSTGTTGTGPSFDHTQGDDQGYYVYIEASSPRRVNDTARLSSALVNDGRPKCLTFWYHMFGPHVNTLNVYTKVGNTYGSPVWQRIGTVDAQWHSASVTLPNTNAYTIVFEGAASITKCTFEDPGICGFTQATGDNFDWKRMNGRTATAGTGPSNDHTLGTSAGYYMYIEASAPRHRGDKAQLISPSQAASAGSCLRFWYHMYGRYMGTLSVYLRTGGRIVNTIFNVSGDQGNRWIQSEVTAVFEGVVGTNYVSDIAIDDVSISPGSCGAAPGNCDFEKDMCTWSNTRGDQFDWLRSTGSTPSQYTGPSTDHTQGNTAGGFVFIESSAPRRTGDKAWLISQPFPAFTGARCFNFWYHMYGSGIGSLNVYVDDTANTTKTLLWSQKDNKGDRWLQGQMPIPPQSKEYLVRVEGIRGSTYYGDIGLDDFSFTTTRCVLSNSPYDCAFETNFCSWTQDKTDVFDWTRGQGPTGNGWYTFIETSAPRVTNDTARLVSQQIPAGQPYCFKFWYHMYGAHVNLLNVYIRKGNTLGQPVWTKMQSQGNQWRLGQVQVPSLTSPGNLVFEGVRGPSYKGDIGLDDIRATPGNCAVSGGVTCTFENGLCGWTQDTSDNFDWLSHTGKTGSTGTGPSSDHTLGHYMYIETSSPRRPGQKARLISSQVTSTSPQCLSFFYNLNGRQIGALNVYVMTGASLASTDTPVWTKTTNLGDRWVPANNDFEHGFGVWTNPNSGDNFDWILGQSSTSSQYTGPSSDHTLGNQTGHYAFIESSAPRYQWLLAQAEIQSSSNFSIYFDGIVGMATWKSKRSTIWPPRLPTGGCDFEQGLCTWVNIKSGDQFDWLRGKGQTGSQFTGPDFDHTLRTQEWSLHVHRGEPPASGWDMAILQSQVFPPTQIIPCFTFLVPHEGLWHRHAFSRHVHRPSNNASTVLWSLSVDQRDQCCGCRALVGSNYMGDLAVDDIVITSSACPSPTIYDCNFESDLCKWQQAHDDKFDWTRTQGPTGTVSTGPTNDHTLGTGSGWYIYIETSSPRHPNDTARLVSPQISDNAARCLSFYYHMYGSSVYLLNVYMKYSAAVFSCNFESTVSDPLCGFTQATDDVFDWTRMQGRTQSANTGPFADHTYNTHAGHYVYIESSAPRRVNDTARLVSKNTLPQLPAATWTRSFDQGNQWRLGEASINLASNFQVVFEGIVGKNYNGDIAVDDITITKGGCSGAATCDFQTNFCMWTNVHDGTDKMDWLRLKGRTQTQYTGPSTDHTKQDATGYYAFIESSRPRIQGDNARLASQIFPPSPGMAYCFSFWFHMYGDDIGQLTALVLTNTSNDVLSSEAALWTLTDNNGDQWSPATVNISTMYTAHPFQIVLEGIIGKGYRGDIAIDDTSIVPGSYIYLEASQPRVTGDMAQLTSPSIPPTQGPACFSFWYHMYGPSIGNLTVLTNIKGRTVTRWSRSGTQANKWQQVQLTVTSTTDFQVTFGASIGPAAADVSLDDISIMPYACASPGSCDFETDLCAYTNVHGTGTLNVYMKQQGGSQTKLFSDQGHHGNSWLQATVDLVSNPRFILVFEGVKGANYTSDIAIDDISVQNAAIQQLSCNFDTDLCQWTQDKTTDQFDWTRQHGSTASGNTGPKFDHTQGNIQGYYIYIETSGHNVNDSARLVSPTFSSQGVSCATFWYNMYGSHVNRLSMYLGMASSATTQMWTKSGNQGASWHRAEVELGSVTNGKLVFEALRGNGYMGDIALDDIVVYQGNCPGPVLCDFEEPTLCGYVQSARDNFDWTRHHGSTASSATGPTNDHTYGTSQGHYMYIESSQPRKIGDKAQFFQQAIQPQPLAAA
nr:hypothetical protein BaRGS_022052 [Batillaria attramentaria]